MSAEVLFDAVNQVADSPAPFGGLPQDRHAPKRAIMLPDESFPSYFLDVFGRPQRISACECERVSEANLAQALHLLNSDEIQGKLARPGGRADMLAKDPRPDAEKVEEMFLWAFARKPTDGTAQDGAGAHRQARQEQEGRLREHPLGAAQHQGVHLQPLIARVARASFIGNRVFRFPMNDARATIFFSHRYSFPSDSALPRESAPVRRPPGAERG